METEGLKITPVDGIENADEQVMYTPEPGSEEPNEEPTGTDAEEGQESVTPDAGALTTDAKDLTDDEVLSFFEKKYGKKIEKLDSLFETPEPQVVEREIELEEDVAAFRKYKKETGRGLNDFMKLQKDFSAMEPNQVLFEYYSLENPNWTREDVLFAIDRRFGFDQDMDDPNDIREKQLSMKSEVAKALDKLNSMKAQYTTPLESRGLVPEDEKATYEAFKQQRASEAERKEASEAQSRQFTDETLKVFSDDFKGFDFTVGEGKTITFKPDETDKIIQKQTNLTEWIGSFKGKDGSWNNVPGFHKALTMAMYGDSLVKHAYEQGRADQVVDFEKDSKNINMPRSTQVNSESTGRKITVLDDSSPSSGRISIKSTKK